MHGDANSRTNCELAQILDTIRAAAQPPEPEPEIGQRSLLWMPSEMRRAFWLAANGRNGRLNALAEALADAARVPPWMASMALDLVYLPGREADLDNADNDAPALELALLAMGLNPAKTIWASSKCH